MLSKLHRRMLPRLATYGMCGVVGRGEQLAHAYMLNLSGGGLRLERPFDPATASPVVQLEIELPDADEILWARAKVMSAHLTPMGGVHANGQPRLWCNAGLELDGMSRAEERLLMDYICHSFRERAVVRNNCETVCESQPGAVAEARLGSST